VVTHVVRLDSGPLGILASPRKSPTNLARNRWLKALFGAGVRVIIPEIADYEVRRELIRARKKRGLAKLDALTSDLDYLPITTWTMRRAAELWALARQQGMPTAGDNTIDADMILAAQAESVGSTGAIVATVNVAHLSLFCSADRWTNIQP
jgi:predicted nucleic acid-binding protein